jgi:glycosyltransferase involved in cell wall biosynthesis
LRILLVRPSPLAAGTGNERSARRIAAGLRSRGHQVLLAQAGQGTRLAHGARAFEPDVVHVYHAFRAATGIELRGARPKPRRVLTFAGSDLPGLPLAQAERAAIEAEVGLADAATVALEEQRRAVEREWPRLAGRVFVVPKGVEPPGGNFPLRARAGWYGEERVALLAAGLRPVKRALLALEWFAEVFRREPRARLVLLGPALEAEYARAVRGALAAAPHALWLGAVEPEAMGGALRAADLVLNVSEYEGQSNALLEAMALGRPVLAAAVPGNREWLRDGENALLFADRAGFVERALRALRGGPEIAALAARGREHVERRHSAAAELDALLAVYARDRPGEWPLTAPS